MRLTIEHTADVVEVEIAGAKIPARVWRGLTDSGIPVHAFVIAIAVAQPHDARQFEHELFEIKPPEVH